MDIERLISILDKVGALYLDLLHCVALDSEVKRGPEASVVDSVLVSLASLHGEKWGSLTITLLGFAIDENALWLTKLTTTVQGLPKLRVALGVPVI